MDILPIRILSCLLHVRREHGSDAYRRAAHQAMKAICTVLIEETVGSMRTRASAETVGPLYLGGPTSTED